MSTGPRRGGATSDTLTDILREMDARELFERTEGRLTSLLSDGCGSRTEVEIIEHANDQTHEWETCIGTPCLTSLW